MKLQILNLCPEVRPQKTQPRSLPLNRCTIAQPRSPEAKPVMVNASTRPPRRVRTHGSRIGGDTNTDGSTLEQSGMNTAAPTLKPPGIPTQKIIDEVCTAKRSYHHVDQAARAALFFAEIPIVFLFSGLLTLTPVTSMIVLLFTLLFPPGAAPSVSSEFAAIPSGACAEHRRKTHGCTS